MRKAWAAAIAAGIPALAAAQAQTAAEALSAHLTVTSDYVVRGVSQTGSDPAVQAGVEAQLPVGFFAGLWASTVDLDVARGGERAGDVELDLYAGYGVELPAPWSLVASLARYTYPQADDGARYDSTELAAALEWREVSLSLTWTDNAVGSEDAGLAWELTGERRLPRRLQGRAGVGLFYLQAFSEDYAYWNLGLSRRLRRVTLDLAYYGTDGTAERVWEDTAGSRWVGSVSLALWP